MPDWWSKLTQRKPPFRWSAQSSSAFYALFRHDPAQQRTACSLDVVLSHELLRLDSWDHKQERLIFGWMAARGNTQFFSSYGYVPVQVSLHETAHEFARRDPRDWNKLDALGDLYLWDRGPLLGGMDGLEISLSLDSQRLAALRGAIREAVTSAAPVLTLGLDLTVDPEGKQRVRVMAYWLKSWPMRHGAVSAHPWADEERG